MTWFNRKKKEKITQTEERCSTFDSLMYNCGASYSTSKAMFLYHVHWGLYGSLFFLLIMKRCD